MLKVKMLGWIGAGLLSAMLIPGMGFAKPPVRHKPVTSEVKSSPTKIVASKKSVKTTATKKSSTGVSRHHLRRVSHRSASTRRRTSTRAVSRVSGKRHSSARTVVSRGGKTHSRSAKPVSTKRTPVKKTAKKTV